MKAIFTETKIYPLNDLLEGTIISITVLSIKLAFLRLKMWSSLKDISLFEWFEIIGGRVAVKSIKNPVLK